MRTWARSSYRVCRARATAWACWRSGRSCLSQVAATCARLADLLEAKADLEVLSLLPAPAGLGARSAAGGQARHAGDPAGRLRGRRDRTHRDLERLVQRVVWLLPNCFFVVTSRSRLQWADIALQGQLGPAACAMCGDRITGKVLAEFVLARPRPGWRTATISGDAYPATVVPFRLSEHGSQQGVRIQVLDGAESLLFRRVRPRWVSV